MDKIIGWLVFIIISSMLVTGGVFSTKPPTEYNADTAAMFLTFGSLFASAFIVFLFSSRKETEDESKEETKPLGFKKVILIILLAIVIGVIVFGIAHLIKSI